MKIGVSSSLLVLMVSGTVRATLMRRSKAAQFWNITEAADPPASRQGRSAPFILGDTEVYPFTPGSIISVGDTDQSGGRQSSHFCILVLLLILLYYMLELSFQQNKFVLPLVCLAVTCG